MFLDRGQYQVYDQDADFHDGGVYYGSTMKTREFQLDCYYEDIKIKTKQQMMAWLDRKTSGNLQFEDMPFKYYKVRPTKRVDGKEYYHHDSSGNMVVSGTMTITFTAYVPYGFMKYDALDGADIDKASDYCGILPRSMMPPKTFNDSGVLLLYNCGTQVTYPIIHLTAQAENGLIFHNSVNDSEIALKQLDGTPLAIDCVAGMVMANNAPAFKYHDCGFIRLEPCGFINTDIHVTYESGSNVVKLSRQVQVGKFIYVENSWHRIITKTNAGYIIDKAMQNDGDVDTKIVTMNMITVDNIGAISNFSIEFIPRIQ